MSSGGRGGRGGGRGIRTSSQVPHPRPLKFNPNGVPRGSLLASKGPTCMQSTVQLTNQQKYEYAQDRIRRSPLRLVQTTSSTVRPVDANDNSLTAQLEESIAHIKSSNPRGSA